MRKKTRALLQITAIISLLLGTNFDVDAVENVTVNATVTGGARNTASGKNSSVSGGWANKATGDASSVSGGDINTASGENSWVAGGHNNTASGTDSSIAGGAWNEVSGVGAHTSGGGYNKALGDFSAIYNGYRDTAVGDNSSVLGGEYNKALGSYSTIIGGYEGITLGLESTVIGGGVTGSDAKGSIAIGKGAVTTQKDGLALGYQSVQNTDGTISFGHDSGDISGYTVSWEHVLIEDEGNYVYKITTKESKYSSAYYNRLVKVADGIDDHDVTTVGQVKKLVAAAGGGPKYTAGTDISISTDNAISVAKSGQIASGNTGIVTGDTVYKVTSKLNSTLNDHGTSITAANNKITSLSSTIETLRKNLVDMNTSVSSTIADLPGSLGNFVNKDLSNLSTDGTNSLKALIKSEIKNQMSASKSVSSTSTQEGNFWVQGTADTSYVDNAVAGKADKTEVTKLVETVANKADQKDLDALSEKVDTKADKTYVDSELSKKADKSTVDAISAKVDTNAENIAYNREAIKSNAKEITDLEENKADVSGSNINTTSWAEKLGTGVIEKDNTGLVNGGTVYSALEEKADINYVNAGFTGLENQMQQMNQSLTRDINKVGAGAAALAGLHPQEYDPDNKLEFAVGYGHYRNANATALGMYYHPNAVTTVSLAGTIGNGDPMLSAGLSFKLGMGKHVEKVMVTKEDLNAMQNRLVNQEEEMTQQKEKIEQLEAMVKQLMAK